jgi:Zn finger protein HypA/HybF involved in hydrogenase expression
MEVGKNPKHVQIEARGRVVIKCSKCNMYIHDNIRLNNATVQCPFCGSSYQYIVKVEAKDIG